MTKRKLARKTTTARQQPHLSIVPPPRRRRRFKVGRIRRPKYVNHTSLHVYEEAIVRECLRQLGRPVNVVDFEVAWPGRFRRRELWLTLIRLTTEGSPRIQCSSRFRGFWAKVATSTHTTFWL